jgi:hypothetical protein
MLPVARSKLWSGTVLFCFRAFICQFNLAVSVSNAETDPTQPDKKLRNKGIRNTNLHPA